MHSERFISARLRHKGGIALAASAISFFVIIIAVAVAAGFRSEIRRTLSSISGDILIANTPGDQLSIINPIEQGDSLIAELSQIPGVESAQAAIYRNSIIQTERGIQGAIVKGSDALPSWVGAATQKQERSSEDELSWAQVPSTLARKLEIQPGDTLKAFFIGEILAGAELVVESVYEDILGDSDRQIIFAPLSTLQELNEWESGQYSAIELHLNESARDKTEQVAELAGLASGLCATPITRSNAQLFDWLNLIDYNVLAILALMIVVAGFNMVSSLLILLFQNISTIGVLKSLGMSNRSIASVFVRVAARLAGAGLVIGNASALLFCWIQSSTHILKLDPVSYFVSFVPVRVDIARILITDAIAFALIVLFMLLPTLFISSVDPARTVAQE